VQEILSDGEILMVRDKNEKLMYIFAQLGTREAVREYMRMPLPTDPN
jgi:hypothetical protein